MNFLFSMKPGLFRLILALIVVVYHITKYVFLGGFAVYCFFMLSGYWLVRMYSEKYVNLTKPTLKFYKSRIIRIYPVYIFITLLTLFTNLTFTIGYLDLLKTYSSINWITIFGLIGYNTGPWVIAPAWSLDIEMQFYVLFPIIWLLISKIKKTATFLILSMVVFLIWFNFCFHIIDLGTAIKHTVLPYLFYFMIGVMLYIKPDFFSKNSVYISLLLCVGIVLLHYFIPDLRLKVIDKNDVDYFEQLNLLLPLLLVPFISYNLKVKSDKKDRQYGNLSYSVYLVHWLLIIPYNHFFSHLGLTQRLPFALLYILATLVVSNYILKYFELPLQKKMRTFL